MSSDLESIRVAKRPSSALFLREISRYFGRVRTSLAIGSVAGIAMNTAAVLPPLLLGAAIDSALAFSRGEGTPARVVRSALLFLAGTAATEGPRILKRWFLITANARIRADLRADCIRGVLGWPMARVDRTPVGELIARIIGDVEVVGVGVREVTIEAWDTVLLCAMLAVTLVAKNPGLSLVALAPLVPAILVAWVMGGRVARRTATARVANGTLTAAIQEAVTGVRLLRMFGREGAFVERIGELSASVARANVTTTRLRSTLQPVYSLLIAAGVLAVVWKGSETVISGAMTVGGFIAYLEIFLRFTARAPRIPQLINSVQSAASAFDRLRPLLATHRSESSPRALPPEGPIEVTVRNVTFRHAGAAEPALRNLSVDIPAGTLVAVTGPVGSGKSALARALLGLYPLEAGSIALDGRPAGDAYGRGRVGLLTQEPVLFSGTIQENVLLGERRDEGANQRALEAVKIAGLARDLPELPRGIDTQIGELGIRLSGGQRQRVGLARAIGAVEGPSPGLLVLDDPFSAVDVDTETRIIEALLEAYGPGVPVERRSTIVLCSHRLAAFPKADAVIVLDRGTVAESGTHASLVRRNTLYARIYGAQRAEAKRAQGVA